SQGPWTPARGHRGLPARDGGDAACRGSGGHAVGQRQRRGSVQHGGRRRRKLRIDSRASAMNAALHSPPSTRVMNLAYWLTHNVRRLGDHIALVWAEKSWSWAELDARVSALSAVLAERGVGPGSAVL